ncbi:HAD family acid phosphatase [Streptomyces sp. NPDC060194]|uniref:phosphatase domain-containing protein n=1 Tax=Streptomyces sp. NPDC060194 TaxID=3347069 RepID=UPI00365A2110
MTEKRRPLAVFDLDNTLADTAHRQHFLERTPRDWKGFFSAGPADPPLEEGVRLALESAEDCEVQYLTGRPVRCRRDTLDWLAEHGLPAGKLWMRPGNDYRPARHYKLEKLQELARTREIRMLVDDDVLVCDAAEQAGFRVVRAGWAQESAALRTAQEGEGRT